MDTWIAVEVNILFPSQLEDYANKDLHVMMELKLNVQLASSVITKASLLKLVTAMKDIIAQEEQNTNWPSTVLQKQLIKFTSVLNQITASLVQQLQQNAQ